MGTPPDAANAKPVFRVKPLSVRPEEWSHREQSRTSELTDAMVRASESTCLEHHFPTKADSNDGNRLSVHDLKFLGGEFLNWEAPVENRSRTFRPHFLLGVQVEFRMEPNPNGIVLFA